MHGTQFKIFLPAIPNARTATEVEERLELPSGNGELVLVADDEVFIREMTRLALESSGYRVLLAGDGIEAVALAIHQKGEIKVAVIDTMMPFLEGPATIRALQKVDPLLKIIRISGTAEAAEPHDPAEPTVASFLEKPFSAQQLLESVHEVLQA